MTYVVKDAEILDFSSGTMVRRIIPAAIVKWRLLQDFMVKNMSFTCSATKMKPPIDKWSMYVAIQLAIRPPKKNIVEIQSGDDISDSPT